MSEPTANVHETAPKMPLRRRPRERAAGAVFEAVTRIAGFRSEMIPDHLRRQLRLIGIRDETLLRVLPRLRSLADWPRAWETEGNACADIEDWAGAFATWYVAQRILLAPSPLKRRLYERAVDAYGRMDQPQLQPLQLTNSVGDEIRGYVQIPAGFGPDRPAPCVLMVPGITGTKEELHSYCMPLLRRGIAIARIDNPGYGQTEGLLDSVSVLNPALVLEHLATIPSLDAERLHLHGMSLGANFVLQSARGSRAAGVTVICPPYAPGRFLRGLPTLNLTALQQMTGRQDIDDLVRFATENTLEYLAPELTMPIRIFHGGRDRTIPVGEGVALARAVSGPVALTIYERDHHNCLEHLDEITALTLEFIDDPQGTCQRHASLERIDLAASIHATDEEAMLASEGVMHRRLRPRMPFALPRLRQPSASSNR